MHLPLAEHGMPLIIDCHTGVRKPLPFGCKVAVGSKVFFEGLKFGCTKRDNHATFSHARA